MYEVYKVLHTQGPVIQEVGTVRRLLSISLLISSANNAQAELSAVRSVTRHLVGENTASTTRAENWRRNGCWMFIVG